MGSNVEIKARLHDSISLLARAARIAGAPATVLDQEDTFFHCPGGRLKLRRLGTGNGELIFYERDDAPGPKLSRYSIARSSDPSALRELLDRAYGVLGVVRKKRTLFLAGRIRIHVDEVERLGNFVELEVVLADGESPAEGEREAAEMMRALGISEDDLVAGAYIDLLAIDPGGPLA